MTSSAPPTTGFGHDFLLPPVTVPIQPPAQPGPDREEPAATPATPPAAQPVGHRTAASSLATSPRAFITRNHEAILIRLLDDRLAPRLVEMYLNFQPRPCFQGLPPIKDEVCRKWIQGMIRDGINLVALSFEQGVVGHTALFPIDDAVSVPVESIMSREVATVGLDDSCRAALEQLLRCRAASLPVIDEQGHLLGAVTVEVIPTAASEKARASERIFIYVSSRVWIGNALAVAYAVSSVNAILSNAGTSAGTATGAASPWRSPRAGRDHGARRSEKRQSAPRRLSVPCGKPR